MKAALNQLKPEFYVLGIILFRASILSDFKLVAQRTGSAQVGCNPVEEMTKSMVYTAVGCKSFDRRVPRCYISPEEEGHPSAGVGTLSLEG